MLTTFSPPGYTMSGVHPHREICASWRDLIERGAVARGEYVLRVTHPSGSQCEYSLPTESVPWFVENTYHILRPRARQDSLKIAKKQVDCSCPAFPASTENGLNTGMSGMSLRDYFAAKAMQGFFTRGSHPGSTGINRDEYASCATSAYLMADAMIRAKD